MSKEKELSDYYERLGVSMSRVLESEECIGKTCTVAVSKQGSERLVKVCGDPAVRGLKSLFGIESYYCSGHLE